MVLGSIYNIFLIFNSNILTWPFKKQSFPSVMRLLQRHTRRALEIIVRIEILDTLRCLLCE